MSIFQATILSIVQGITEFLPVSSSGHLNLFQHFLGLSPSLSLDIFLNTATFLSVIFFFRKKIKFFFDHFWLIVIASIPAALVGIFLNHLVDSVFSNYHLLPFFFFINSFILFSTHKKWSEKSEISLKQAILIGLSQSIAILPGVSRAGTTIATGLALGLSPETAFNFSFCLFIPASFGALLLEMKDSSLSTFINPTYFYSFILTFVVGLIALNLLKKILASHKLWYFGIYTLTLSLVLFFVL